MAVVRIVDEFKDLGDVDFPSFSDGFVPRWDAGAGKLLGSRAASLGVDGKVPASELPALAITDVFPVASEAAMLALNAQRGDVAVRSDIETSFILAADDPTDVDNWIQILSPSGGVSSFNGRFGNVLLAPADISDALSISLPANTSGDGLALTNPTDSADGNQRYSPALRFTGQGWKTGGTPVSETVDFIFELQPQQGGGHPYSIMNFASQVNGGGYFRCMYLDSYGDLGFQLKVNGSGRRAYLFEGDGNAGLQFRRYTDNWGAASSTIWSVDNSIAPDTMKIAAGVLQLQAGTILMLGDRAVEVGDPDSGGSGFRLLRIAN